MPNLHGELRDLLNENDPIYRVTVLEHRGTHSLVAFPGGNTILVRGTGVDVGKKANIQGGEIRQEAPNLDQVTIVVY